MKVLFTNTLLSRNWKKLPKITFCYKIIPGFRIGSFIYFNPSIFKELRKEKDSIIICGGKSPISISLSMVFLSLTKQKWGFWDEAIPDNDYFGKQYWFRRFLRKLLLFLIAKKSILVLAVGKKAKISFIKHNIPVNKIFLLPYVCEPSNYYSGTREIKRNLKNNILVEFLFVGDLTYRKGFDIIIEAIKEIIKLGYQNFRLTVVGNGFYSPVIKAIINKRGNKNLIDYLGFIEPIYLRQIYQKMDVLLCPSRYDGWAMVINEAAAAGLAIISSSEAGASIHLVRNGFNGFIINPEKSLLVQKIRFFLDNIDYVEKFKSNSLELIHSYNWNPMKFGELLISYINKVIERMTT